MKILSVLGIFLSIIFLFKEYPSLAKTILFILIFKFFLIHIIIHGNARMWIPMEPIGFLLGLVWITQKFQKY